MSQASKLFLLCLWPLTAWADNDEQMRQIWRSQEHQLKQQEQAIIIEAPDVLINEGDVPLLEINQQKIQVANNVSEVGRALFLSINHKKWSLVQQYLTIYETFSDKETSLIFFAKANLAQQNKQIAEAEKWYRQLMIQYPEFSRGKLELARLLFDDQQSQESKVLFQEVLGAAGLPEGVRVNIQSFVDAIDHREAWHGSFSIGGHYNDNVNQGAGKSECLFWYQSVCLNRVTTPDPIAAHALAYEGVLSKSWQLSGHHYLSTRGLLYGYTYPNKRQYNEDTVQWQMGYAYKTAQNQVTISPQVLFNRLGNQTLYQARGAKVEWQSVLSDKAYANIDVDYKRYFYKAPYQHNDSRLFAAYATFTYLLPKKIIGFAGLDYAKRSSDDEVNDYAQKGVRLGVSKQFRNQLSATFLAMYKEREYDGYSRFFGQRKDEEHTYLLNLKWPKQTLLGLTPNIMLKHTYNKSSADTYFTYRRNEVTLKLEKHF